MSDSILQAGLQGVSAGIDQFGRASGQIVKTSSSQSTANNFIAESIFDVKQAQKTIVASAAVIAVADEILGSLLDELA